MYDLRSGRKQSVVYFKTWIHILEMKIVTLLVSKMKIKGQSTFRDGNVILAHGQIEWIGLSACNCLINELVLGNR